MKSDAGRLSKTCSVSVLRINALSSAKDQKPFRHADVQRSVVLRPKTETMKLPGKHIDRLIAGTHLFRRDLLQLYGFDGMTRKKTESRLKQKFSSSGHLGFI